MTKKVKSYGFQTVLVNNLTVFSFGALFSRRNIDVLDKHSIPYNITHTNKLNVEFATTDHIVMGKFSQKVGKAMKEIAQRDLESKYFWVEK